MAARNCGVTARLRRVSVRHCRSWICACARARSVWLVDRHTVPLGRLLIGAAAVDFCCCSGGSCNSMTWPHNRHGTWEPTPSGCAELTGHERVPHVLRQRAPIAAWPTSDVLLARAIDGWQFAASLVDADCDGISSGAGSASAVTHHHSCGSWLQPGRVPTRSA
jgi:hypothetical protein